MDTDTREYRAVLSQMSTITDHLKLNKAAKDSLTIKYQEKKWLGIAEHPEPSELVTLVLGRIANDPGQYRVFMDMLNGIAGMDLIVKGLALPASNGQQATDMDRTLGSEDLRDILVMVNDVSDKWMEVGLNLKLKQATLTKIDMEKRSVDACKREMFSKWLQWVDGVTKETCTWQALAKALEDELVGHGNMADKIREKYGKKRKKDGE